MPVDHVSLLTVLIFCGMGVIGVYLIARVLTTHTTVAVLLAVSISVGVVVLSAFPRGGMDAAQRQSQAARMTGLADRATNGAGVSAPVAAAQGGGEPAQRGPINR
ncbi:hypothetical protein [Falsiroseomonas sp. HW251]|uniref:hypothetical protein n=1 Tax=Falsiroseomonas sp. HW251 TaxID=3390998 RepID=UPI003D319D3C